MSRPSRTNPRTSDRLIRAALGLALCAALVLAAACTREADIVPAQTGTPPDQPAFPDGFMWGVGYSAYQTEGDNYNVDYDAWNRDGHGADVCGRACNSFELYALDAQLAADLGCNAFRMGVEWSRVQPRPGEYDEAAIAHYREALRSIREQGMEPIVTLHHFTNPQWFADRGGWLEPDAPQLFADYVAVLAARLGDLADWWIPINEPVIYTTGTYLLNTFPGGRLADMDSTLAATWNMVAAHAAAYHAIHAVDLVDADRDGLTAQVGLAKALSPVRPLSAGDPADVAAAAAYDYVFNRLVLNAWVNGMVDADLDGAYSTPGIEPAEGLHPELQGTLDWLGVNYYNPVYVRGWPGFFAPINGIPCYPQVETLCWPGGHDVPQGDNGNQIDPQGLYELLLDYAGYGLPLLVSENGLATTDDELRSYMLVSHLMSVEAALARGVDVRGYWHWSLLDNFEWLAGYDMRFGLYRTDFATFERQWTAACDTYAAIIAADTIPDELRSRYAQPPE